MSEYVESRYAKLVLDEARCAEEKVASKLRNELVRDLGSPRHSINPAREQALNCIRVLALNIDRPDLLHVREWDAANQAAEDWCRNAFH